MEKFTGKVWVLGDDIDTDIIIPTEYLALKTIDDMKQYGFSPLRPELAGQIQKGDIIVAGKNFGCGSSREHAPIAIKASGISCVIASTFARIFYRNSINIGLAILECDEAAKDIKDGDEVKVGELLAVVTGDIRVLLSGVIKTVTTGKTYQAEPFPPFIQNIISKGGLLKSIGK